jgi:hypothetical protein
MTTSSRAAIRESLREEAKEGHRVEIANLAKQTIAEQHAKIEALERQNVALREETERQRIVIADLHRELADEKAIVDAMAQR